MGGAVACLSHALVVDLSRRDVLVAEKLLDLEDVHAGLQKQSRRRRTKGVRRVDAAALGRAIFEFHRLHRTRQALEIAEHELVHRSEPNLAVSKLLASRVQSSSKEWTRRNISVLNVLLESFRELGVDTDRSPSFAPTFLANANRRVLVFHVEVFGKELRPGSDARSGEEVELENRPVAVVKNGLAVRIGHELPSVARRQRLRFLDWLRRWPLDEVLVRRVLNGNRELCVGCGFAKELKEPAQRRNPPVQGLRREVLLVSHEGPPFANVADRCLEEFPGFLGPTNPEELNEALDVTPVAALRVVVLAPSHPRLEHRGDGAVEALDLADDDGRLVARDDRR